jgi:hypothetical protein
MSCAERLVTLALANAPIPLTDRGILQLNGHTGYPWPWLSIPKVWASFCVTPGRGIPVTAFLL